METTVNEIKEYYQKILDEEVRKRRFFEDKYYQSLQESQKDGSRKRSNPYNNQDEDPDAVLRSKNRILRKDIISMNIFEFLWRRFLWRRENVLLLRKEKEYWTPVFDYKYYANHNKDIRSKFGMNENALRKHFICFGMIEGRKANDKFDVAVYIECNYDITMKLKDDTRAYYLHYINNGIMEDRRCI